MTLVARVTFLVLVGASFSAFFVAQRLKSTPAIIDVGSIARYFSPNGDGNKDVNHVSIRLRSAQNRVRLGSARVRRSGRFRFRWTPDEANVGPGRWRVVVRMRCESGDDGSPVIRRRGADIRVRT